MKLEVLLDKDIVKDDELCCKVVVTGDKISATEIENSYCDKLIHIVNSGGKVIYFVVNDIIDDKKIAQVSSEFLAHALFNVSWYFKDNNIDVSDFKVVIFVKNEVSKSIFEKECSSVL